MWQRRCCFSVVEKKNAHFICLFLPVLWLWHLQLILIALWSLRSFLIQSLFWKCRTWCPFVNRRQNHAEAIFKTPHSESDGKTRRSKMCWQSLISLSNSCAAIEICECVHTCWSERSFYVRESQPADQLKVTQPCCGSHINADTVCFFGMVPLLWCVTVPGWTWWALSFLHLISTHPSPWWWWKTKKIIKKNNN